MRPSYRFVFHPLRVLPTAMFPLLALLLTGFAVSVHAQDDAPRPHAWSPQHVETAQAQCRANMTATGIEGPKVERYCQCAAEALQQRFSYAEVRKMRREHNPADSQDARPPALAKALEQCSPVLESK